MGVVSVRLRGRRDACAAPSSPSAGSCSSSGSPPAATSQQHQSVADANNDGDYIAAGPITYQLQISRELNPYGTEDSAYLKGLPAGRPADARPNQLWYGVFLWAKNQTGHPATTVRQLRDRRHRGQRLPAGQARPRGQPVRVDLADPGQPEHRAGAQHGGQRRPDPGRPAAVQDQQLRLLQPAADPLHPRPRPSQARRDLARPLTDAARPARRRIGVGSRRGGAGAAAIGRTAGGGQARWGAPFQFAQPGTPRRRPRGAGHLAGPVPPRPPSASRTSTRPGSRRAT